MKTQPKANRTLFYRRRTALLASLPVMIAVLFAACCGANAEIFLKSQIVGFPTGNLGGAGLEGWVGDQDLITVTNGSGSLDGSPLGLVASKGDRVFLSRTNLADVGSSIAASSRNVFVSGGAFRPDIETNLYYSFLLEFNDAGDVTTDAAGELITQVNRQNASSQDHWQTWARNAGGQIQLGIRKRGGTTAFSTANITAGETVLVVVRQHIIPPAGTNDVFDLWINPSTNSLGGAETNLPASSVTVTGGTGEDTSNTGPGRFYLLPGANLDFDELRIANTWAEVTPSPLNCSSVAITVDPVDTAVAAGISVTLSAVAAGTSPDYQWQLSTDAGGSWADVASGSGGTTSDYLTPNLTLADNGNQYRCIASVDCDSSSATSAVATVTVTAPVVTGPGVIMDDTWADLNRTNAPVTTNNSIWYASTASSLTFSGGDLFGAPASSSSRLWLGYFTDDTVTNLPVSLAVGGTIKATWVFNADGIVGFDGSLRVGLYDYADGGTRVMADDFGSGSTGNGVGVRGYMLGIDFAELFTELTPFDFFVRNDLTSVNLMGTTSAYGSLGSGPPDLLATPGFQSLTDYSLELSVSRTAVNSVDFSMNISGGGTNWAWTVTDDTYAYHRFDAFGIRANSLETTANDFLFESFTVEVTQVVAPDLDYSSDGSSITFSWTGDFKLQAQTNSLSAGLGSVWADYPGGESSPVVVPVDATQGTVFFRLSTP